MPKITSELLVIIRAARSAARELGCILNTPKANNQAMILNFVSNNALEGRAVNRREIQAHVGFTKRHTNDLLSTMVSEGKLIANLNNKPAPALKSWQRVGNVGYTFAVGQI